MVTPNESFQNSCGLWVAQTVVRDNENVCWVQFTSNHHEDSVTYKISQVRLFETIESEHQVFSVQTEPTVVDVWADHLGGGGVGSSHVLR